MYSELEGGSLPIDVFILARERHRQREEEEEEAPLLLMASSAASSLLVAVVVLVLVAAAEAAAANETSSSATAALRAGRELRRYRRVQALLRRVNKPAVRTIESPDGDLIDCVAAHLQPAFDHRGCAGRGRCGARRRGRGVAAAAGAERHGGGRRRRPAVGVVRRRRVVPEGSVPIRRTTEADVLRASSVRRFGRAPTARVRRDSVSGGHEVSISSTTTTKKRKIHFFDLFRSMAALHYFIVNSYFYYSFSLFLNHFDFEKREKKNPFFLFPLVQPLSTWHCIIS